jgi:hypothetical protein
MKSFSTAAKAAGHEKDLPIGEDVEFEHDGRTVKALSPTGPQLAIFLAAFGDTAVEGRRVVDTINFFSSRFVNEEASYFRRRLNDPDDAFDFDAMSEILVWLIEEWSGRPTTSPSDSSRWPQPTGNGSTAGPQDAASTPSAFGLTGS